MKKLIFLSLCLLFSLSLYSENLAVEKRYNIYDEAGKPLKNRELKTFLIQTVVYNDGKNNEFEGSVCEEEYHSILTSSDGVFNLKLSIHDLSKESPIVNKKIKKKNLELYIICEGYEDNVVTIANEEDNIVMIKKSL